MSHEADPQEVMLDVLGSELKQHLRLDIEPCDHDVYGPRLTQSAVAMTFPSGYRFDLVILYAHGHRCSDGWPTTPHSTAAFRTKMLEERGIDVAWCFADVEQPPSSYAHRRGWRRFEMGLDTETDPVEYWCVDSFARENDPLRGFRGDLIRHAAYRTLDVWGPLDFAKTGRGVGVLSASARGSINGMLGSGHFFSVDSAKQARIKYPIPESYGPALDRLTQRARTETKARAAAFARRNPPVLKSTNTRRSLTDLAQDYAANPAPHYYVTVEERAQQRAVFLTQKQLIRVGQSAASLYKAKFGCDPLRKRGMAPNGLQIYPFAYGTGGGMDIVDEQIDAELAKP